MLKKLLGTAAFILGSTYSILWYSEQIKQRIDKLAETETVDNQIKYVAVRAARGHYNKPGGIEQMMIDYKFYKTISKIHE